MYTSGGTGSGAGPFHGWRWRGSAAEEPLRQHLHLPALLQEKGREPHARPRGDQTVYASPGSLLKNTVWNPSKLLTLRYMPSCHVTTTTKSYDRTEQPSRPLCGAVFAGGPPTVTVRSCALFCDMFISRVFHGRCLTVDVSRQNIPKRKL